MYYSNFHSKKMFEEYSNLLYKIVNIANGPQRLKRNETSRYTVNNSM